jgi:hypothetical protein
MNIIGYGFHTVGEFLMTRDKAVIFIAFEFRPAVVDDEIFVSGVEETVIYH